MSEICLKIGPTVVKTCPVCGKNFIPNVHWAYKLGPTYYCRYNCYSKAGGDSHKKSYKRQYVSNKW